MRLNSDYLTIPLPGVGTIERSNQILWRKIKNLSNFGQKDWRKYVEMVVEVINISHNMTINTSSRILIKGLQNGKNQNCLNKRYKQEIIKGKKKTIRCELSTGEKDLILKKKISDKLKKNQNLDYVMKEKSLSDAYITNNEKYLKLNKTYVKKDQSNVWRETL